MGSKININDKHLTITAVKWNGLGFLASGISHNKAILLQSKDGIEWHKNNTVLDYKAINSIIWYNEMWIIAGTPISGTANTIQKSTDGNNWTVPMGFSDRNTIYSKLVHNGKRLLALGRKSASNLAVIIHSVDGINWIGTNANLLFTNVNKVLWNGTIWIAGGEGNFTIATSETGSIWSGELVSNAIFKSVKDIAWNDNIFVAFGEKRIAFSSDGIVWTQATTIFANNIVSIYWNDNVWEAIDSSNNFFFSNNAVNWSTATNLNLVFSLVKT
jgi:hypothetical protein